MEFGKESTMVQLKRIISWLAQLLRNRSQAEQTIVVKGDVYVDQKIVVIIKDHNDQSLT